MPSVRLKVRASRQESTTLPMRRSSARAELNAASAIAARRRWALGVGRWRWRWQVLPRLAKVVAWAFGDQCDGRAATTEGFVG